jgi:hypothetical protein
MDLTRRVWFHAFEKSGRIELMRRPKPIVGRPANGCSHYG